MTLWGKTDRQRESAARTAGMGGHAARLALALALAAATYLLFPAAAPVDFAPLYRDTAMVVRSTAALERPMLADFVAEIARECEQVGMILDNRLVPTG